MSQDMTLRADPVLTRLAEAILIPPFPGSSAPRWILDALGRGLAGVTLFGQNISTPEQVSALTASLRAAGPVEPVIAIDEEGGDVTRVAYADGSPYPGNAALGAVDDIALTGAVYRAIGADLAALGVNFNLAPCADVLGAADSPAVGTRSFGMDTALVARHTAAAVTGLQDAGVAACTKHFPGHGRTGTDTHEALATIDGGLAELRRRDLPPFVAAIAAGTIAVMPSHLRIPELTGELPATVSRAALTGLLRGELGFTGVIVSDALEMRAIRDTFGIAGGAVLAVAAGTDLLCLGRDSDEDEYLAVRTALVGAVRDGALAAARLEEAADRVARLREGLARLGGGPANPGGGLANRGGGPANRGGGLANRGGGPANRGVAGDGALRLIADRAGIGLTAARRAARMSGPRPALSHPLIIEVEPRENMAAGRFGWGLAPWAPTGSVRRVSALGNGHRPAETAGTTDADGILGADGAVDTDGILGAGEMVGAAGILAAAAGRSLVAVVRDAHRDQNTRSLIGALLAARPDLVLVEMGLPRWQPPGDVSYLATYGASRANAQAAAELLGLA